MRSRTDRVVGGVCGGVARHYGLDPTLVRVGFVAGVILWGATAVLYLVALLLMPEEPEGGAPAQPAAGGAPPLAGRNGALGVVGVVVLVLVGGPLVLGLGLAAAGLLMPFALLVLAGLAVAALVTGRRPAGGDAGEIVRLTLLGLGVLGLLALLALGSFWGAAAGGDAIVAAAVVVAGLALVASAFARPARWLILPALALAIPAGFVAAAGIDLDGGVGEKRYEPAVAADIRDRYELGAGKLTVDLRDVELPAGERRLEVEVGMGEAVVLVPEDVCVSTAAELGMGGVHVFDRDGGGIDVDWQDERTPPAGTPRLVVDADVGLGEVEVGHAEHGSTRFGRWRDDGDAGNEACRA
jgi:phage shock protein PspC (stress-responsive transcriptional regulator)